MERSWAEIPVVTLRWSIDRYVEAGVPRERILLGLPLLLYLREENLGRST